MALSIAAAKRKRKVSIPKAVAKRIMQNRGKTELTKEELDAFITEFPLHLVIRDNVPDMYIPAKLRKRVGEYLTKKKYTFSEIKITKWRLNDTGYKLLEAEIEAIQ